MEICATSPTAAELISLRWFPLLVLVVWTLSALPLRAQFKEDDSGVQNPTWSMAVPRLRYVQADMEAEQTSYASPGAPTLKGTRWYLSPRVGMEWQNYLYHPDLFNYSLLFEPGYVWQDRTLGGQSTRSDEFNLNGTFTGSFLQLKPYATTANYNRTRDEVKYDFFDTATVDSQTWGVATGYRDGPVPVSLSFHQTHDDALDFNQETITDQSILDLSARNERHGNDLTEFDYQFNQFQRDTYIPGTSFGSENDYNHLALLDSEHFENSALRSSFRFDDRQTEGLDSTDLNAALNYTVDHTSRLHSYYDYSFSQFTGDDFNSIQNYADAGVRHQLFDSLTTGLEAHGTTLNSDSGPSSLDSLSGGGSASLDYTRHISTWGRLNLGNVTSYSYTDQEQNGTEEVIANEPHAVPLNGLVRLNLPRVQSISTVTTATFLPLQPGLDYTIISTTDPWQVQILTFGPAHVQPGATILITYTIQSNPSGNFSTWANQSQIRLSFLHEMAAVFARYGITENHASSPEFLLQDDRMWQTGAEFTWHGVRLYGDYTQDRSTLYDTDAINLAEAYSVNLSSASTLGIDLNQQWNNTTYNSGTSTNLTDHMRFYDFMVHYDWHPNPNLSWNAEIGYRKQSGVGLSDDLFAARTYLKWRIGKLQLHVGYEHELQDIVSTTRSRDFGYVRVRRDF